MNEAITDVDKSVFSYLRRLTTRNCPHSHAAATAIDQYHPPTAANLQSEPMLGHTDVSLRSTDTVPFYRHCSAYGHDKQPETDH